jgi:hypothetical protein
MLTKEVADKVVRLIENKCYYFDFEDACEYYGITSSDFDEFIECAYRYIDLQD